MHKGWLDLHFEFTHKMEDPSLMSTFDLGAVDEMDPSLAEGHRIIYDREVPFELRIQESGQTP
jgi:hypothetical protein